jgi:hypothetical protein
MEHQQVVRAEVTTPRRCARTRAQIEQKLAALTGRKVT